MTLDRESRIGMLKYKDSRKINKMQYINTLSLVLIQFLHWIKCLQLIMNLPKLKKVDSIRITESNVA